MQWAELAPQIAGLLALVLTWLQLVGRRRIAKLEREVRDIERSLRPPAADRDDTPRELPRREPENIP